jgi:hypothetical protein
MTVRVPVIWKEIASLGRSGDDNGHDGGGRGCEEERCCVRILLELRRDPIARRWAVVGDT